tara:strand:- start:121 stop:411 length:291 start_codon:yes stop_codon:yes gene_type:complete
MNKYTFEYWFRDRDEWSDYALVEVKADNKNKALILAKENARHKHPRNFKIVDFKEFKEKGEVCNDCGLELDVNYNCNSQTCINNITVSDTVEITNN